MSQSDFDMKMAKIFSAINTKVFEYLTRITLVGIAFQISQSINNVALEYASVLFAILLGLQLLFEINVFFDWVASKVDIEPNIFIKGLMLVVFSGIVASTFLGVYMIIVAFNEYYLTVNSP